MTEPYHDESDEPGSDFDGEHDEARPAQSSRLEPLELGSSYSDEGQEALVVVVQATTLAVLSILLTLGAAVPLLTVASLAAYGLIGRLWITSIFSMHASLLLVQGRYLYSYALANSMASAAYSHLGSLDDFYEEEDPHSRLTMQTYTDGRNQEFHPASEIDHITSATTCSSSSTSTRRPTSKMAKSTTAASMGCNATVATSLPSLLDIVLWGILYPKIFLGIWGQFFVDVDGEPVQEWYNYYRLISLVSLGQVVAVVRTGLGIVTIASRICQRPIPSFCACCRRYPVVTIFFGGGTTTSGGTCLYRILYISSATWILFLLLALYSVLVHFTNYIPEPYNHHANDPTVCDPLDATECILPFPSFFHAKTDPTTATGWRVQLHPEAFPMLKGRVSMDPTFLNNMDGFGTMGPIMFYIEGLKEAHEHYMTLKQSQNNNNHLENKYNNDLLDTQQQLPLIPRLRGHPEIHLSVQPLHSITYLMNVESRELVAHSAEIDYLDPQRPIVMVFPARPLQHNTEYALAVVNATHANGSRIKPTPGMIELLSNHENDDNFGNNDSTIPNNFQASRQRLYRNVMIPALEQAMTKADPNYSLNLDQDLEALQLLFNFHTASADSQLGPVRTVRDATLDYINKHWGGNRDGDSWENHVRVVKQIDRDCRDYSYPLARTIHAELDVPWFLDRWGPGARSAILDLHALRTRTPRRIYSAKFIIQIPCSLQRQTLERPETLSAAANSTSKPLRAVVEFGHGLFGSRAETYDGYLIQMAHNEGYLLTAMDWRGMSQFDMLMAAKMMVSNPSLFQSLRDNLIQGYANKWALQHLVSNGLLDMPWLEWNHKRETDSTGSPTKVPSVFYGNSQGGILGAGYLGLSGVTGLIDRGVLGVPGTPFSLIMSRSLDFKGYDLALLLNFYNNRHVRILLSLAQMCWDSVEGAGVLATPQQEPLPRVLMQAGLGDPVVPTLAAERLARGFGASILPNNPRRPLFEIPVSAPANASWDGPNATLTEMLYQEEYASLPVDDKLTVKPNFVHWCVRNEPVLVSQASEFINTGRVIDVCAGNNGTSCILPRTRC